MECISAFCQYKSSAVVVGQRIRFLSVALALVVTASIAIGVAMCGASSTDENGSPGETLSYHLASVTGIAMRIEAPGRAGDPAVFELQTGSGSFTVICTKRCKDIVVQGEVEEGDTVKVYYHAASPDSDAVHAVDMVLLD